VRLWVLEANRRARAFYERHGFGPDGCRDTYTPTGSDAVVAQVRYTLQR
jgi:ribosomal protein S18 acetylase RimI-like enzyme